MVLFLFIPKDICMLETTYSLGGENIRVNIYLSLCVMCCIIKIPPSTLLVFFF